MVQFRQSSSISVLCSPTIRGHLDGDGFLLLLNSYRHPLSTNRVQVASGELAQGSRVRMAKGSH